MNPLTLLVPFLVDGADKVPAPEDVKAGWVAFAVFIALAVAVALLGWSLSRHLRTAGRNRDAGAFGPVEPQEDHRPTQAP